ncbi:MAG: hypothetical protein OJF62_002889 [Pseudolabrys sp.]|jgi:hypothetical protein|nr:hypothetical protein [Pseudolabrys sp.]
MSKPSGSFPRPLADLLRKTINEGFARQGFASSELVTRWAHIAGAEIAAHCEPIKIQWPRAVHDEDPAPGTLVLRVEGPAAIEIQHLSGVILERVNRFFGWQAIGQIALRQAPLRRAAKPAPPAPPDPQKTTRIAAELGDVADEDLKGALARLGAMVKRM